MESWNRFWRYIYLASFVLVVVLTASCVDSDGSNPDGSPATSALNDEQATEILQNALDGFNAGDYAIWSRDWSDALKAGIPEDAFLAFREQQMSNVGRFISLRSVKLTRGQTSGFVRWVAIATVERGEVQFSLAFREDGDKAEGAFFEILQ